MRKSIIVFGIATMSLLMVLLAGTTLLTARQPANAAAVEAGNRLVAAGNYDEAIQVYEQLVAQDVHDSAFEIRLGELRGISSAGRENRLLMLHACVPHNEPGEG